MMHEDAKSASFARFRELISQDGDADLSLFVLKLVRELLATADKPLDDFTATAGGLDHELCLQVIDWLDQERIVAITGGTVQLTPAGRQSLTDAARTELQLSGFLTGTIAALDTATANLMVLAILKAHFEQRHRCKP